MSFNINPGVFPTMITPFDDNGRIDREGVEKIVEYYVSSGCTGIFAICQSSEMFFLSDDEKKILMGMIAQAVNGRIQIVASGHTADDRKTQINQLASMVDSGADAAVIVLNRLAAENEIEDVVKKRLEEILKALPGIYFGIYECPYPYKRLASPQLMKWCAETGRIVFIKDTCCRLDQLEAKQQAVKGTSLKIYNANTATLLDSIRIGIEGYSGIMANFHADLYTLLFRLAEKPQPERDPRLLQSFLTLAALIEHQLYPVNAKYHMAKKGIPISLKTRVQDASLWNQTFSSEVNDLIYCENLFREMMK